MQRSHRIAVDFLSWENFLLYLGLAGNVAQMPTFIPATRLVAVSMNGAGKGLLGVRDVVNGTFQWLAALLFKS